MSIVCTGIQMSRCKILSNWGGKKGMRLITGLLKSLRVSVYLKRSILFRYKGISQCFSHAAVFQYLYLTLKETLGAGLSSESKVNMVSFNPNKTYMV